MNVEIINVGTELLLGEIINTNATYLQKMCKELGFNVFFQTVVGDNSQRFLDCLEIAFNRGCDCVITTGGLGPTEDDLTKELSAKYLGLEMIFNEAEAKKVNDKCCFVSQLDQVTDNNFKQAYFPKDCYVLDNPIGTANGCVMSKDKKKKEKKRKDDNIFGLVLGTGLQVFNVILAVNFFKNLPVELEEAAWVDGATTMQSIRKIVSPLMFPGICVVFIYTFSGSWGNFFIPYILLSSADKQPAAVLLYQFFGQHGSISYGPLAAFSVIYALPSIILYILSQNYMSKGFTMSGAAKG